MSGIAGIFNLSGAPVAHERIDRMLASMSHRGPDGRSIWRNQSVALGHLMLHTTPESLHETLPLVHSTGEFVLVSDARIDNRDELIAALNLRDRPAEKFRDSDLIMAAYEKWGETCPSKLLGAFAFVIWDRRKQLLFCARDHFGLKPLFYYQSKEFFAFASEIKALLSLPEVTIQPNELEIALFVQFLKVPNKSRSFFHDILRLAPAHFLSTTKHNARLQPYWELNPKEELSYRPNAEYIEEFLDIFTEAVRCRLRSAFPVGSMLSGGLDSSSVTCIARNLFAEIGTEPLPTFSAIMPSIPSVDESEFIQAVLAQGGFVPNFLHADSVSPMYDIERLYQVFDEPQYSGNSFILWWTAQAASMQGIRVILNGFDGDTTVSHGLFRLKDLVRDGNWKGLAEEIDLLAENSHFPRRNSVTSQVFPAVIDLTKEGNWLPAVRAVYELHQLYPLHYHSLIKTLLIRPLLSPFFLDFWHQLRGVKIPANQHSALLAPAFSESVAAEAHREDLISQSLETSSSAKEHHYRHLMSDTLPQALEIWEAIGSAFTVEYRAPFMDKRLIEYCFALPSEQKLAGGWTRAILRHGMKDILPLEVQWRSGKANQSENFASSLLKYERERIESLISKPGRVWEYMNLPYVREAATRFIARGQHTTQDDITPVWIALTLELWLEAKF